MTFEDDLKRLEPFLGHEKMLRLWRAYQYEDMDGRRDMEAAVQIYLEQKLGITPMSPGRALSVPQSGEAAGEYELGAVVVGDRALYPFGLREDEFIQHMAIFGRSGAGKTNTVAVLIKELVRHNKPFMIFDWKRNYRDMLAPAHQVPMEVYTVGRPVHPLRFNPLIPPPGTDIKIWLKKLIEIISNAYYLGEGVVFLLLEALDHIYEQFGCYKNPESAQYPCMTDVLQHLLGTRVTGRKAMWMDSTLRAVQSLCFGQISDVINVSHSDSIMELLDKNVCLELNALGSSEKTFFIETLLVWIHHCRMLEGARETFKHCIIIEEAHNILSASTKETVVDVLMREIRELGEAIVLIDQHPSLMSIPAIGNTYCTIALNAKHSKDLTCLGEIMQVPRDDRTFFSQLPMGHAVVKLQSRYILPFQVRLPRVPLDKGSITDTDIMQMYPSDSTDSAAGAPGLPEPELSDPISDRHEKQAEPHHAGPSVLEERLLQDIREHPLDGVVKRYTRLGVSRRRGNHAKESLMAKNLILSVDVPTKTGKSVLLDLAPHVKETLRQKGIEVPTQRDGGLIHTYWKEELRRMLAEHGWTVTLEMPLGNGEAVDLAAVKGDSRVALEVETGTRGCDNILRLLDQRFEWIVTFSVDAETEERTKRALMNKRVSVNHLLFASPTDYDQKVGLLDRHVKKN